MPRPIAPKKDGLPPPATLTRTQQTSHSQLTQDLRQTVSLLAHAPHSALSILDASAVEAIKGLYYMLATDDPLNAMPAHKLLHSHRLVPTALLPLAVAVHHDPAAASNPKRWSIPLYQTLRLLTLLSTPVPLENLYLPPGCNADANALQLRADLAQAPAAVAAFVALLQYYLERKAEKQEALATAESSKLEDARIETILRLVRNLLAPPRPPAPPHILSRDPGIHLALVAALVSADFYSTLAVLFSSRADARSQYTDLVFLVADIYAHTFRHVTPRQLYLQYRAAPRPSVKTEKQENSDPEPSEPDAISFPGLARQTAKTAPCAPTAPPSIPVRRQPLKPQRPRTSSLRAAIQRERAYVGGTRAVTTAARWTSRHSGGFCAAPAVSPTQPAQARGAPPPTAAPENLVSKRIVSARNLVQSKLSLNPLGRLQEDVRVNSEFLCMVVAKGRRTVMAAAGKNQVTGTMRRDLQEQGRRALVELMTEMIEVSFPFFVRELRDRIEETKKKSLGEDDDGLTSAQRSFLRILGSVVGFQREKYGKVFVNVKDSDRSSAANIHEKDMKSILSSDFKVVRTEWVAVEAGIEVDSFRLVFRILVDASESLRAKGRDTKAVEDIEQATFAVLEMMKMLQGMTSNVTNESTEEAQVEDADKVLNDIRKKKITLTPRELALNTLEELFEREDFLNAPADLAKDYDAKLYSFCHLTNVVEVAHVFTTILLDETELSRLQVTKKRKRKKAKKMEEASEKKKAESCEPSAAKPDLSGAVDTSVATLPVKSEGGSSLPNSEQTPDVPVIGDGHEEAHKDQKDDKPTELSEEKMEEEAALEAKDDAAEGEEETTKSDEEAEREATTAENDEETKDDGESSAASDSEPELREIESTGIIRRFAHAKALQTLSLPIRTALCNASSLTGTAEAMPEGSNALLAPIISAKSAHVLAAVWRVTKVREKGALCGQFFTYSMIHLLGITLRIGKLESVRKHSVLERLSILATDVTKGFYSWLSVSPGMVLDLFFVMDKGSCLAYANCIRNRTMMLRDSQSGDESGNDSDFSILPGHPVGDIDVEGAERRESARKARKNSSKAKKKEIQERRRAERAKISDDEDVDDLDALQIGRAASDSDSDSDDSDHEGTSKKPNSDTATEVTKKLNSFCRLPSSKRRRCSPFDPFASDDEEMQRRPVSAFPRRTLYSVHPP